MRTSSWIISCSFFSYFLILCSYSPTPTAQSFDYPTANLSTTWTINQFILEIAYTTIDNVLGRLKLILLRETNVTRFALGFFCKGYDYECTSYIFAIFILSNNEEKSSPLVWSANRDYPVHDNAILSFSAAGELVLRDADGSMVWTTNTAGKSVVGMNLTDTGNLVLYDVNNQVVWQSFDHPTDCLLLGQKLYQGQKLIPSVSSTNWTSQKEPPKFICRPCMYSLQVTDEGLVAYVDSNPPQAYYSYLVSGAKTSEEMSYAKFLNGSLALFINSTEPSDPVRYISISWASSVQYMKLMPDGHLRVFELQLGEWRQVGDLLTSDFGECGYPLGCGRNALCSNNNQCFYSSTPTAQPLDYPTTANLSTTWTINPSFPDYQYVINDGNASGKLYLTLLRETNVTQFALGFFCQGSCTSYLFAIFILSEKYSAAPSPLVWSANRDYPVQNNATLNLSAAGELVLRDADGSMVWTTNTAGKSVIGMNLTDTGNLVLYDVNNQVVWQSFDHPTDCLLPGQKLYQGQKLISSSVSLTNWTSQKGMYSLQVTDEGLFAYIESNPPQDYFSHPVNGAKTSEEKSYAKFLNGSLALFINSNEPSDPDRHISIGWASSVQYMKLMPDGHLRVFELQLGEWRQVGDLLTSDLGECGYPLVCGRNAICSDKRQCSCPVLSSHIIEYFRAVNDRDPSLGCSEITPLTCSATQDQDFITIMDINYFTSIADIEKVDMETCKEACLNNCSCKAALFKYDPDISSGKCYLPSDLFTMAAEQNRYESMQAFIKVQNVRTKNHVGTVLGSTIGSSLFLLILVVGCIMLIVHKNRQYQEMEEEYLDQLPGMPTRFSFEELKTATENFSKKLGEGGFGTVFEGILEDGSKIAVKCLEGLGQVNKSFLAEVESIGSIHHVNLVRLRGYSAWKSQRLLVYDFMSNGSLDRWIYHGDLGHVLDWECRKNIIFHIAKGLAYLHEDCRQQIIHLDIKPQNILLDNNFNAKVSDFGLSKLVDKNQTQVMTTIKGTPGYIAPECWSSSIITEKVDVYSFGIVVLEILCGRKIFDRSLPEESWHLLSVFQKCWEEGTLLDMVDRHSEDMQANGAEVVEMMKVASWCLQTDFTRRPSMSSVVKVLEGGMSVETKNLDYNFTDPRMQKTTVCLEKDLTQLMPSFLSGPR